MDRRTSESYTIHSARLTLGLAVQPETLRQWLDATRGLARGSGFLARFLIAHPDSTQGLRPFKETPTDWPSLSRFYQRLSSILLIPLQFDDLGLISPKILDFTLEAKSIWINFHDEVERSLSQGGEMADARDIASKAADNAARLAALFHVFDNGPTGKIGSDNMQAAASIVAWHLFESKRFLDEFASPLIAKNASILDAWLMERCGRDNRYKIPVNHIQKFGPTCVRRKQALDAAIKELEDAGRVRRKKLDRKTVLEINPALTKRF